MNGASKKGVGNSDLYQDTVEPNKKGLLKLELLNDNDGHLNILLH